MIDRKTALKQVNRLAGLDYFPAVAEAQEVLVDVLVQTARTPGEAELAIADWLVNNRQAPKPIELRAAVMSQQLAPEYSADRLWGDDYTAPEPNAEKMRRREIWQPKPFPNQCTSCGGLGFLYTQIPAPPGHPQAGDLFDAVKRCHCAPRRVEPEPKARRATSHLTKPA